MKKISLSGFDLGALIAFGVLTLLGIGGWWYLSGELADSITQAQQAKSDFDKYSKSYNFVVSRSNNKILQTNIDVLKAQLDPLVQSTLVSKDNKLAGVAKQTPLAWKHDLDAAVQRLVTAAKAHNVAVPNNFYFGFSRYQSQSPGDVQTPVLSKQLLGMEQLVTVLINANVNGIQSVSRTYEEDPKSGNGGMPSSSGSSSSDAADGDHLPGYSISSVGGVYKVYPFELGFDTTPESLRPIVDNLIQSPYVFVIRTITIDSSASTSPMLTSLDALAAPPTTSQTSLIGSSPGETAQQAPATKGPQFLFGNASLKVKMRVDLVEWTADLSSKNDAPGTPGGKK